MSFIRWAACRQPLWGAYRLHSYYMHRYDNSICDLWFLVKTLSFGGWDKDTRGPFQKWSELLTLRVRKLWTLNEIYMCQCMSKIFWVKLQRVQTNQSKPKPCTCSVKNLEKYFQIWGRGILIFMVISDVYSSFIPIKTTFTKYCFTAVMLLPGSFEIYWVRQYLVNFYGSGMHSNCNCLQDLANFHTVVSGMANCPNF